MRYKFYIASLLVSIIFISSCSKTIKVTVYGSPGTEIRTPEKDYICTIDSSGTGIAEINADYPYGYLLSKTPDSKQYIPFAMDWKKASKDITFLSAGVPGSSVGVSLLAVGLVDFAPPLVVIGGLTTCGSIYMLTQMSWLGCNYGIEYIEQQTNNDLFESSKSNN
ncbi:MAG: hypothetical protein J6R32_07060 [Bacteroidales bacterium]|nr:hypothetical protein [Bacteroidales bacterium]